MPHLLSCANCRRRKIKCNKTDPCTHCAKARLSCVFPPSRRHQKGGTQPDPALIAKIQHLENILDSFRSASREDVRSDREEHRPLQCEPMQVQDHEQDASAVVQLVSPISTSIDAAVTPPDPQIMPPTPDFSSSSILQQSEADVKLGRLIRDDGRSICLGGTCWPALAPQIDQAGQQDPNNVDREDHTAKETTNMDSSFPDFPFNSSVSDRSYLHPSPRIRQALWGVFKENVDPVVKILHLPTTATQIDEWLSGDDMTDIPGNLNALLFAMYFSAVTSMENDECTELLGTDRDIQAVNYRSAAEKTLTDANFLLTDDIVVMQSLVLYIATLRHHHPRLSWTLSSLAFRLLQASGFHRDGTSSPITVFESEMRKRLNWFLLILECGAAEDPGCDPTLSEASQFNSPLPTNLNDRDLDTSTLNQPDGHTEWTESTLLLLWADNYNMWRLIFDLRRHPEVSSNPMNIDERKRLVDSTARRFDERYIKTCSPLTPIQWVTATSARLLIHEYKLVAYKPLERDAQLSQEDSDDFFNDAIECLSLANKLLTDRRGVRWAWLIKTFFSWRPLAHILAELTSRPLRKGYARAWSVVEQAMVSRWKNSHDRQGPRWRSMSNQLAMAKDARSRAMKRQREPCNGRADRLLDQPQGVQMSSSSTQSRVTGEPPSSTWGSTPELSNTASSDAHLLEHCIDFPFDVPMGDHLDDLDSFDIAGDLSFQGSGTGLGQLNSVLG